MNHRLIPLCLLLFLLPACTAARPDPFANIPPRMQSFVDNHQVAGIVALVATQDHILHLSAVGTSDGTRPMQTSDLFWIASMSKPIIAAASAYFIFWSLSRRGWQTLSGT